MSIINNNVQNVKFLRNGNLYNSREDAYAALTGLSFNAKDDGTAVLARYNSTDELGQPTVKTLIGWVYAGTGGQAFVTVVDMEAIGDEIDELRQEIMAILGTGVTSADTVTAQLEALSGDPSTSVSSDTSVEGAKRYTDVKIDELKDSLDYADSAISGSYVSEVNQVDGIISVTRVELPTVVDTKEDKKFVIAVSEDKGEISIERGSIESSGETMVLTDAADGGVNFEVNIDNESIVQDPTSKKIKVADSALTQHYGDEVTIHMDFDTAANTKTFSTLLSISSTTVDPADTNVKEQYNLVDASGNTIGDTIKIYKDSSMMEIYVGTEYDTVDTSTGVVTKYLPGDTEPGGHVIVETDLQWLNYVYRKEDETYEMVKVDLNQFLINPEFASGITVVNGVAIGVVDPSTEQGRDGNAFLTVGEDGFKVDGIVDEIKKEISDLDATVSGVTSGNHITLVVEELDGKLVQSGFTFEENDIASQSLLDELSAKTVTIISSSNDSISATSSATADGTVEFDVITDASLIKMTGFTADVSGLTAITEDTTVTEAVKAIETEMIDNELTVSSALNDLNNRLIGVEQDGLTGVTVNGSPLFVNANVANMTITPATTATTATGNNAITVDTDPSGNLTIGIATIDCGTYDNP